MSWNSVLSQLNSKRTVTFVKEFVVNATQANTPQLAGHIVIPKGNCYIVSAKGFFSNSPCKYVSIGSSPDNYKFSLASAEQTSFGEYYVGATYSSCAVDNDEWIYFHGAWEGATLNSIIVTGVYFPIDSVE